MKNYTVLLLYPDYINDGGQETYFALVDAETPAQAVTEARIMAMQANDVCDEGEDFHPLLVLEGNHAPLCWKE